MEPNLQELIVIRQLEEAEPANGSVCVSAASPLWIHSAPLTLAGQSILRATVLFLYVLTVKTANESSKWIYRPALFVAHILSE